MIVITVNWKELGFFLGTTALADDRENYQYIMLNGKHLSLLAVNRHTTRIES